MELRVSGWISPYICCQESYLYLPHLSANFCNIYVSQYLVHDLVIILTCVQPLIKSWTPCSPKADKTIFIMRTVQLKQVPGTSQSHWVIPSRQNHHSILKITNSVPKRGGPPVIIHSCDPTLVVWEHINQITTSNRSAKWWNKMSINHREKKVT